MAGSAPPARRRPPLVWVLGAVILALVIGIAVLLALVLVRPSSTSTAAKPTPTPTPAATATPSPGVSGSGEPATSAQRQQYRAYVSTVIQSGTAVVADIAGLVGCAEGRPECARRLNDASNQVSSMQRDLAANPPPPCLTDTDARLQDSLTFQQKGLDTARNAVVAQNRIRLVQGLLLTAAGLWRGGQAIVDGRQANC